jgi:hypothetical protein
MAKHLRQTFASTSDTPPQPSPPPPPPPPLSPPPSIKTPITDANFIVPITMCLVTRGLTLALPVFAMATRVLAHSAEEGRSESAMLVPLAAVGSATLQQGHREEQALVINPISRHLGDIQ